MKAKKKKQKTTRGWEVLNHRRRKDKQLERSMDLTANNQILSTKTTKW
jgi:hypothetical protein